MTVRAIFAKVSERLFRTAALREARARVPEAGKGRDGALRQARLVLEVARRVAEPVENLPPGARPPVILSLYREAVYWAFMAGRAREQEGPPPDLETLWNEAPPDTLARAGGGSATLDALKRTLVTPAAPGQLDATDEDAARARRFSEALVAHLEAPGLRVQRLVGQRWISIIAVSLAVVLLVDGVRILILGPNLAADRPFRTSSSWAGCAADSGCTALLFHTDPQLNPWVEFDLGAPMKVHRVEVTNREDCCSERTIPLVIDVSTDRAGWTEVARRDAEFSSWTAKFSPKVARYVRLRIPRQTVFHLKTVAIR